MIKLVVISDSKMSVTHFFDQSSIKIGQKDSSGVDLVLPLEGNNQLLEIISEEISGRHSFQVINVTRDPSITLNGYPFEKQHVQNKDEIRVGNFTLLIDSQVAHIFNPREFSATESHEMPSELPDRRASPKLSLKDYYLSEYDDDNESNPLEKKTPHEDSLNLQNGKTWRFLFKTTAILGAIAVILFGLVYLWASDQSGEEEIRATKGVVDAAMALTYAHIKHIHPQNQNWSDPEFIKNNLTAVLASEYASLADFDAQGKFANSPYMLRIYTSSDSAHFLVIAQPAPSLFQWLIPKASIVIDSHSMEMRKLMDLKALNRLLVNTNTLDNINSKEISNLVSQGELIPLAYLVNKKENQGFSPPKALALIRPSAENLIYNAPRYYSLGQNLISKSLELLNKQIDGQEILLLKQELEALKKFPNLVLYSSEGIQQAIQSQNALALLDSKEKFLIAYLQRNSHGKISSAHLLMDDAPSSTEIASINLTESDLMAESSKAIEKNENAIFQTASTQTTFPRKNDDQLIHPIFLPLKSSIMTRCHALKPLEEEMAVLIHSHTEKAEPDFLLHIQNTLKKYEQIDQEHKIKILSLFGEIAKEQSHIPAAQFQELIQANDLELYFQEYLKIANHQQHTFSEEDLSNLFHDIDLSKNWAELEKTALEISEKLQFVHISDLPTLIGLQNDAKIQILQKINQFLLESDNPLPPEAFTISSRQTLLNILKAAWVTDTDMHDFYIAEFDIRTNYE